MVRGYLSRSSAGPNCSGLTKMETAVTSQRAFDARTSERWPSCSAPMVGTNPRVLPLRVTWRQAAFISAMVAMRFTGLVCVRWLAEAALSKAGACLLRAYLLLRACRRFRLGQHPALQHTRKYRLQARQIFRRTFQGDGIHLAIGALNKNHLFDPVAIGRFLVIADLQHLGRFVVHGALLALQGFEAWPPSRILLDACSIMPSRLTGSSSPSDGGTISATVISSHSACPASEEAQPPRHCHRKLRPAWSRNADT